jgi:predicted kinase
MKKVIILAGIPGSGKSTYIKKYMDDIPDDIIDDMTYIVVSADHYFMQNGVYSFRGQDLGKAHTQCSTKFHEALDTGIELIFVDNTNIHHKHRKQYIDDAIEAGYHVEIHAIPCDPETAATRNVHGVPLHACQRMHKEFDLEFGNIYSFDMEYHKIGRIS